jgi:hypothetical protein
LGGSPFDRLAAGMYTLAVDGGDVDSGFAVRMQLRDEALAKPLRDRASAHAAVRQMLAKGLADPYTRFLAPQVLFDRQPSRVTCAR